MTADALVVLCTAPTAGTNGRLGAVQLAERLVDEGLAACVNVVPGVRSFFRWEGRVDVADEVLLVAKTTSAVAPRLRARIVDLHPYAVPEVLEVSVRDGLPAYLEWLAANVRRDG